MKILNVLLSESAAEAYHNLSHIQTTVLMHAVSGKVSYDTARPETQEIMDQLVDFGLLDQTSFEATPDGMRVAGFASKLGSRDARTMQQRNAKLKPFSADGKYSEVGDLGDNLDDTMGGVASINGDARMHSRGRVNREQSI